MLDTRGLVIGELAVRDQLISREQLEDVVAEQAKSGFNQPLGSLMLERKLLTRSQLENLLKRQKDALVEYEKALSVSGLFGRIAIEVGLITERQLAEAIRRQLAADYEGKHTISFWGGYTLTRDSALSLAFTPMFGVVAGDMSGVSPGGELSLKWKLLEFYTENEYVHDFDESSNSFFYSWSELTASLPLQWRVGGAMQRTQTYQTPREFQGGVLVGTTLGSVDVTAYVFDLDLDDQTFVLSAAIEF